MLPGGAVAQDYPNRAVTIVAPAAPGGLYSLFARIIGNKLEQRFGKPFIVENRPGASAIVGSLSVIRAPHDGTTLMIANNTGMAVNVTLRKDLPYDPANDFAPIALIVRIPEVLVVNAGSAGSFGGRHRQARQGDAGRSHLRLGGRGDRAAFQRRAARECARHSDDARALQGHAAGDQRCGRRAYAADVQPDPLRAAARPGRQAADARRDDPERLEAIPDVPPLTEIGVKDFDAASWFMLVAPARTPPDIVDLLHREVRTITEDPEVRKEFVRLGLVPVASPPPAELKAFVRSEIARWGEIVESAGLQGTE